MAELAYLFECHFSDGTAIVQTPEDISSIDPTRSEFFDVLQRTEDIESFGIYNNENTYAVDLRDGHFEINGIPFEVHGDDELPVDINQCKLRLIYFRRHRHTVTLGLDGEEHDVAYHVGWQTTIDGKNYQRTISVF